MKYEVIGGDVRSSAVSYKEAIQTDGVYAISGNRVPEGNDYYLAVSASPRSSGQTKKGSFVEAMISTTAGWLLNYTVNLAVLPLFGFNVTYAQAFYIGCIFTVISVVRSYVMRRVFNSIKAGWNKEERHVI